MFDDDVYNEFYRAEDACMNILEELRDIQQRINLGIEANIFDGRQLFDIEEVCHEIAEATDKAYVEVADYTEVEVKPRRRRMWDKVIDDWVYEE